MSNTEPLIDDWLEAKRALVLATEKERLLRNSVVGAIFPDAKRGTNKYTLPDGTVVKYVRGLNIKLIDVKRDYNGLEEAVAAGRLPAGLIVEKITYEVNESKYAGLTNDQKAFLSGAVEVKDRAPTLSVD